MKAERIQALAKQFGALRCAEIDARQIDYDRSFRDMCEMNSCGVYGKNYMCPPSVGPIDELMAEAKRYPKGVLYQTVFPLEDSFDFEGMIEAKKKHARLSSRLQVALTEEIGGEFLHLSGVDALFARDAVYLTASPAGIPSWRSVLWRLTE